jgi:hypothetical protein
MKACRVKLDAAKAGAYHDADAAERVRLSMGIGNSAPACGVGVHAGFGAPVDDAAYRRIFPYSAEICALTELKKKPGIGVKLRSGMGGHCLLYLNGVRLDRTAGYPTLRLCEPGASPGSHGAGISVNSHYKNANWIAAEGSDFLWTGALEPGDRLNQESYERTQRHAKAAGILDGVEFHEHLFRDKPASMSDYDYMHEISIGTDYGARFGRDIYRARIALDHGRMAKIVDYLNDLNAPYRAGHKIFRWNVINNNCVHIVHNALAAAGVWRHWPTGQLVVRAAFKFPVPKNEFVDLALRANDLPIEDMHAVYKDAAARRALFEHDALPTAPGALVMAERAMPDNDIYEIDRLRLIFYDNPVWGPYRFRFARILREPRYSDLRSNLHHFAQRYAAALQRAGAANGPDKNPPPGDWAQFRLRYGKYIAREAAKVNQLLASLDTPAARLAEAAL